ncbi:Lar family restriction alleviation protein [Erwinia sp. PK3-005]
MTSNDELELKPCPFCGCYAEIHTTDGTEVGCYWYFAKCWACEAETGLHESDTKARAFWNQRVKQEQSDG